MLWVDGALGGLLAVLADGVLGAWVHHALGRYPLGKGLGESKD